MSDPARRLRTVLYVSWAPFFSGAERALVILLENLDPARFRPVVIVGTRGQLEVELKARGITTVHIPIVYSGLRSLPAWIACVGRIVFLARREGASLIHANDAPSFQPAGYAARLLRIPAVTHVRFPDSRAGFEWFFKPGFDRALFVSAALRDDAIEEAADLFANHSEVVHDGVRLPQVPDAEEIAGIRAELGVAGDRTVVAITGQVSEIKGIWDFIDAADLLVKRGVPALFAVLGDDLKGNGALRVKAEQVVKERGLASNFRFLGFRPDAPRLIPAFDIVAVPSHVEPLGNATLEAMAAARPVVGARVGGIPEMIVEGETGSLVPSKDPAALAAAIELLVRDSERARAFGEAGRRRASAAFGTSTHAFRVQDIYDRLLGRGSAT